MSMNCFVYTLFQPKSNDFIYFVIFQEILSLNTGVLLCYTKY